MTARHETVLKCLVAEADGGQRLDAFLARAFPILSRSRVQVLIDEGAVRLGGRTIGERRHRVKPGDEVQINVPEPAAAEPEAEAIALAVVFEDDQVIVIDKPAGMVVHPAAGHATGTLVNALIAHCGASLSGIGGVKRPGIVHRLDKDTSGLLVVAKTDVAHRALSEQFAAHGRDGRLVRSYRALCWRVPQRTQGTIDAPLGRSQQNRMKISVKSGPDAREAVTHYEVLEIYGEAGTLAGGLRTRDGSLPLIVEQKAATLGFAALLRLDLETGRTHQIRVHMAHIGHPLLGDNLYGGGFKASARKLSDAASNALERLDRQALHAAELGFEHPTTGEPLWFESPLPADMQDLVDALSGA